MAAKIHLDRPHAHFTNLDYLTGKVVLQLYSDTSISSIHVKLEGESRTRLSGPRYGGNDRSEKKKTELETHKILYKVASVFPSPDIAQHSSPNAAFTLAAGVYEYPFRFKFPFNNSCSNHNSMMTNISMAGLRVEVAKDTNNHVKKTLPPSMNTFPGEAEIKYYVKVTVVRPQFYKENIRALAEFNFLPIEPPRSGKPNEETYARRQQEFSRPLTSGQKKGGLFKKKSTPTLPLSGDVPPRVSVDARLPNPPILTCNEPVPLRVIVTKQSQSPETIYLQLLQIELISYTHIRAHDLARTEPLSTLILSRSNMNMPLGRGTDPVGKEWKIDAGMWNRLPLPPNIAPSFETCNISRHYEMEVRVGLAYGALGAIQPQLIVLPLRLGVKVYSGIQPPPALLEAVAAENKTRRTRPDAPVIPPLSTDEEHPPPMPQRPTPASSLSVGAHELEAPNDAPPSYEDAMADDIGPIDGPRREYYSPNSSADRTRFTPATDVKTPIDATRDQERVYVQSSLSRDSSESIDMLPTTPGSRPESLVESLIEEPTATHATSDQNSAKGDQSPDLTMHGAQDLGQPGSSRPIVRTFSTGIPNRRPVPGTPGGSGPSQA